MRTFSGSEKACVEAQVSIPQQLKATDRMLFYLQRISAIIRRAESDKKGLFKTWQFRLAKRATMIGAMPGY